MPDPMTTVQWGSWVEVNPRTASELGLSHGDWVEVQSTVSRIELPVFIFPAIRPDVVGIPCGRGSEAGGRYARGRGVNPMVIVADEVDDASDVVAKGATRVRLKKISSKGRLITAGHPGGSYRGDLIGT